MEGLSKFITILHGGGSSQFITILQWGGGGGSLGTPNLYYVIYGRPLISTDEYHISSKSDSEPRNLTHRRMITAQCTYPGAKDYYRGGPSW